MRLADGRIWPIPIVLDISDELVQSVGPGSSVALRDPEGVMLAALHVEEIWQRDRREEAMAVYGTTNPRHPGAHYLLNQTNAWNVAASWREYGGLRTTIFAPFV
jgi:sulfate adenylyltransferase